MPKDRKLTEATKYKIIEDSEFETYINDDSSFGFDKQKMVDNLEMAVRACADVAMTAKATKKPILHLTSELY